ncbi:MAG: hypothetical protein IPL33_21245 [Sphingobacteriales bacterium]|nr:hypothetical protein [Sphingobacteriales bacterium]
MGKGILAQLYAIDAHPEGMLQVIVTDKDPQFAATMANDIVARLDTLNLQVVTEKKRNIEKLYRRESRQ